MYESYAPSAFRGVESPLKAVLTYAQLEAPSRLFIQTVDYHRLLGETSYLLLQDVDPHTLAQSVYRKLCEYLPLDAYVHYLLAPDESHLQLASAGGKSDIRAALGPRLELGEAVCGTVAQTCEGMHIKGVQQRTDTMTALIRSLGLRAYTCQPLFARGKLLGTFSFGITTRDRFYKEELDIFQLVARQIAVASDRRLQNERLLMLEREAILGRISATIAHEINNPLDSLTSLLYLLRSEVSKDAQSLLQRAEDEVAHLTETSRRTLELVRGSKHPPKPLLVGEALREIAATIRLPKDVPLEMDLDSADLCVNVVPGELRQATYNLLLNAAQFTPPGGKVVLTCARRGECAEICVIDQGPGISEEVRGKIFQPYYTTRGESGTGLGLWVSRALMFRYGGNISFESCPAVRSGTTFILSLPLACA